MTILQHPTALQSHHHRTQVELTWIEKKIEHWIRFGRSTDRQVLDSRHSVVSFDAGAVFAVIRWASNDFGTVASRIDILRAADAREAITTIPFVRPGATSLLCLHGWPKVQRVLEMIDSVEACGVDPADAAPDYWRHVHNRLVAGLAPRPYSRARHLAWLLRSRLAS